MFIVVTEQVFTEIWHAISHFKVYKMGFSEKKKITIQTQELNWKINFFA